ncbi:MAG: hemerythrin domain-containing protein [Actinobacteria bacterium]|nr:hemerythrin domain-containing protein [Actinomycetota bacterium]
MSTTDDLTRRGAGAIDGDDVVDLILGDHAEFERLLRILRSDDGDRATALGDLADLLVAHAEAEEAEVYPTLRSEVPDDEEGEIAHGREEHAEGHEELLALLEIDDVDSEEFSEQLEEVSEVVMHHLDEEEREVLNLARAHVPDQRRAELGRAFMSARAKQLASNPGNVDNVRRLVEQARDEGLLDD